jgi:hypothetical protein
MFHTLWGKAQQYTDYDKREWVELQAQIEALQASVRDFLNWTESGDLTKSHEYTRLVIMRDKAREALRKSE